MSTLQLVIKKRRALININFILIKALLLSSIVFGQNDKAIENNIKLKKYGSIEITNYINKQKKVKWSTKLKLENGKIKIHKIYNKSVLVFLSEYFYDKKNNLEFEIVKFEIDKGKINDTINYKYLYNDNNQLIEKNGYSSKEIYSNFNTQNFPQTIESGLTPIDSAFWYKKELIYDVKGNKIEEKSFSKIENSIQIETTKFKYDEFNNLIELNRSCIPKVEYPIIMTGGTAQYEIEKFRYVYNKDNFWIEKYWIVENKENLIQKRKFK